MAPILVAENISFTYQTNHENKIIEGIQLELAPGTITLLQGKSGSGKSTLAHILSGLYPDNAGTLLSGRVQVAGQDIHQLNPHQRVAYITMMFQNSDLQFCMDTLQHELEFCLENIKIPKVEWDQKIKDAVEKVGAESLLNRLFHTLSGGEKQRCGLACVLIMESKVLILDEAFANVDRPSAKDLIHTLSQLNLTLLAIDHQIELWEKVAHKILVLEKNKIEEKITLNPNLPFSQMESCPESSNFIETKNLKIGPITFPDMTFKKGCITAITGKSGRGKTTLFYALMKERPYEGSILLEGKSINKFKQKYLFEKCGMVFQNPGNQFISFQVYDELYFSIKHSYKKETKAWMAEKTETLLEEFGFTPYKSYSPYALSQGQQRKLAVLTLLAGQQELLLLDEPTYGQDPENVALLMDFLAHRVQKGLTVIFNTHDEKVAHQYAHKRIDLGG